MYEKILIATDFSKYAEKMIDCVGEIPGVKEIVILIGHRLRTFRMNVAQYYPFCT